ncbi:tubulin epsilon and delta complex protein 2 isoform X3 [Physeter macrocephalus]|uniref:Tubulin epsilon and delta complex protein 2 isoform X3 n=1 Tax=Physeter macrocephalus TaxID=9755 RepID=A0A2Y9EDU8_PHYMC|nr:tubulin epsilon and delta complex protein 2 isoform X3 [Physeter catodon]|eukprot:XP_007100111.1 tubulin epsilon and delta complex protein 2 isoform X3 [Physeter catodon]
MATAYVLLAGSSRRLVAELRDALDSCAERQRQLERSLRVCRRLLRAWEPAETLAPELTPGPETNEEAPSAACIPSPQDLKELELLTQALEKAVRVRKGISKAGEGDKAPSLKSGSIATSPATRASAPPSTSRRAGSRALETKPPRGIRQTRVPVKDLPERRLLSVGDQACMGQGAGATKPESGLRNEQIVLSAASQAPEAFTLKDKGILLQLPEAFRKAASWNSRLWAQLSSTQTSDSVDAVTTAKMQFLQKMQTTSGWPGSRLSATEVEAEVRHLQKACLLLRLRMGEELTADPKDWMQEYRCLLTLEELQAIMGQCLRRLRELCTAVVEQQLGPWPEGRFPRASLPCGGGADPIWSPQLLLYSSTQELQTLAALRLRVAMLHQQIHLEKVLMAELLPLVSKQEPLGPPWLALCRAVHSLLCEGGQHFLTILREDKPAD